VALAGCSSLDAGSVSDESAPRLTHILMLPTSRGNCTRCATTDLLDTSPPAIACSNSNPCPVTFQVNGSDNLTCGGNGLCADAIAAAPVPANYKNDGNEVRIVFSRQLDPNLNMASVLQSSSGNVTYSLNPGVVDILDANGNALAQAAAYYDPTGSALADAVDIVAAPLGPALNVDVGAPLGPGAVYTIRLDTARVKDESGRGPTDGNGRALPVPYTHTFIVEPALIINAVTPKGIGDKLDVTRGTPVINADDAIQITFNEPIKDPSRTGSATLTDASGAAIPVEMWTDRGTTASATACGMSLDPTKVDVVAIGAPGQAITLPAGGPYALVVSGLVDDVFGKSAPFSVTYQFFVSTAMSGGPNSQFVLPEQCK
jgi:hypothetical protein